MTTYSTTTRIYRDYEAERRQESTVSHVVRGWFPNDPEVLSNIQRRFRDGEYETNSSALLTDIKSDPGLFSRVLARLPGEFEANTLMADLASGDAAELFRFVPKNSAEVSRNRLCAGTPIAKSAWATAITSTNASDVFAHEAERRGVALNPENAWPAALLRQLGLNLLAWNYPSLLSRIVRSSRGSSDAFDIHFERLVGFSPLALSQRVVQGWNIGPEVRQSIEKPRPYEKTNELRSVCEFGELFAKKQQKALFPAGGREWDQRKEELLELIGASSEREVEERIEVETYERLSHLLSNRAELLNPAFSVIREPKTAVVSHFPFSSQMPDDVKREFEAVYEAIRAEARSIEAIACLAKRAIPAAGFVRGIICVEDASGDEIETTVRLGVRASDSELIARLTKAARESRESNIPMLSEIAGSIPSLEQSGVRIASAFKSEHFSGVLVLEGEGAEGGLNQLAMFKAVRACLEDCLA